MYLDPITNFNHANTTHRMRIRKALLGRGTPAFDGERSHRVAPRRIRQP
jgi:hypothetical protein